jgi:hypothetical protein
MTPDQGVDRGVAKTGEITFFKGTKAIDGLRF